MTLEKHCESNGGRKGRELKGRWWWQGQSIMVSGVGFRRAGGINGGGRALQ